MILFPKVQVKGADRPIIFVQGGMGIGVSGWQLAKRVAERGGVGTISCAAIDEVINSRMGIKLSVRVSAKVETELAKKSGGFIAGNCLVAAGSSYRESVFGLLDSRADAIVSGGGLPLALPVLVKEYAPDYDVALIPIASSLETLSTLSKYWNKRGKNPDAVIVEGPSAGGHLGFKYEDIDKPESQLEKNFAEVKEFAVRNGDYPVIPAGGIFYHHDILKWIGLGADGVQMASRFAVTFESSASKEFKQAIIDAREEDIVVSRGSPCGLPFRVIKYSPGYLEMQGKKRRPHCNFGYVLRKDREGRYSECPAKTSYEFFDICNVLLAAIGDENADALPIYSIGQRGHLIDRECSVDELMDELFGII